MKIILSLLFLLVWVFLYAMCKVGKEADEKYEELFQKKFAPDGVSFMEIDYSKVTVGSEQELIELVQSMNADIENSNRSRPIEEREEVLNLDYILSRYKTGKRKSLKGEDSITSRMLAWEYSPQQKEEIRLALAAKIQRKEILSYFYPETDVETMRKIRTAYENKIISGNE